jgi:hypothetical protein
MINARKAFYGSRSLAAEALATEDVRWAVVVVLIRTLMMELLRRGSRFHSLSRRTLLFRWKYQLERLHGQQQTL